MTVIAVIGVCGIFLICILLIELGISLDRIANILERIACNIKKGGAE